MVLRYCRARVVVCYDKAILWQEGGSNETIAEGTQVRLEQGGALGGTRPLSPSSCAPAPLSLGASLAWVRADDPAKPTLFLDATKHRRHQSTSR